MIDTVLIAISPVVVAILVFLLRKYYGGKQGNKWEKVNPHDTPIWLMHFLYNMDFRDKRVLPSGRRIVKGDLYEYEIHLSGRVSESTARVKDIIVSRRIRRERAD